MQPGFGGSIWSARKALKVNATGDFRDSHGDGTDDRDQRRPGGRRARSFLKNSSS